MKENSIRILLTLTFSLLATAVSSVAMYILPVIYFTGYVSEIPPVILGFVSGAIVFSSLGTILTYRIRQAVRAGLVLSIIIMAVMVTLYRLHGPVDNLGLVLGSIASQSFSLFFATMFQSYPEPGIAKKSAVFSIVVFALVNFFLFVITAGIYAVLGEEYLPNIIAYLELVTAVILAIIILYLVKTGKNNRTSL